MSDFRQFIFEHKFPLLVICEPNIPQNFRLSGYEVLQSVRRNGLSRLMLSVRTELTYVVHPIPPHSTNEYVCVTIKRGKSSFTVIGVYLSPNSVFDSAHLENILSSCTPPHVIIGDFNAHNPVWGSTAMNIRGRHLAQFMASHNLHILNDGSPTYLRGVSYSSCLDLAFASSAILPQVTWSSDIEIPGSDHIPTYIIVFGMRCKK